MATMVKENRKEKKKSKSKSSSRSSITRDLSPVPVADSSISEEIFHDSIKISSSLATSKECFLSSSKTETAENEKQNLGDNINAQESPNILPKDIEFIQEGPIIESNATIINQENVTQSITSFEKEESLIVGDVNKESVTKEVLISNEDSYKELSNTLERMAIPENAIELSVEREFELLSPNAYLRTQSLEQDSPVFVEEDILPSAPCLEEIPQSALVVEDLIMECKPKVPCMPIEDVMRLYSGGEMEDVRAMSEREEELVEAGPVTGPEHPLVDLLSTFRSSLMAVERERILLTNGFADEEISRNKLWKVEKRHVSVTEKCPCGASVELKATYEHAELVRERLPIAKMRLESLLRDLQDSYCHHQHAALLAYYQIEELISETIQSNKSVIREALSLVLIALRQSAGGVEALASALQRWAGALAAALIDHRDLRQLLFIMHHLFKQSRSVRWASRVIQVRVDIESPPRILALLELLLARPRLDTAQECTEEDEEVWEEVDKHGDGGAVSEGTLRERDLLALLHALPIRDLVARILLFTHNDIRQARAHEWADNSGGRGVLRACYGVRSLLHVLQRAAATHASYARLKDTLRDIAAYALHGLACLHISSCEFYAPVLQDKLTSELEASFFEGFQLFESRDVQRLPSTLLADVTAKNYCLAYIDQLHEPALLSCAERVRIVSQAAVDRELDHELARLILEFLLQTGLRRKAVQCKGICEASARECVPLLLAAHPYLHTMSLHILADMNIVEVLDVSCVQTVHVHMWRPTIGEARALLDDWSRRCPLLLQHLLLQLDCTPYTGLPLDVQLTIGTWICTYVRSTYPTGVVPECWWSVLRRLRTHRSAWLLAIDAPPPDEEPTDLFSIAYALLSSSWGHCIPLICSEGVSALCKLSASRPREAAHCLTGIMFVMSHSPESVALTPKFNEVFSSLLSSGPSLVARALGRGGVPGAELLLRLILAQLDNENKRWLSSTSRASVFSAWLNALWRSSLPATALTIADTVACVTRQWPQLDAYANALLQEETSKDHINHAVKNAYIAPLLCECLLRVCHMQHETLVHYGYARLLNALQQQRAASQKIHVDNALQQVSANISSEELVIHRVSTAALVAPMTHPSHLTLWRLLLHLYLQRAPDYLNAPPVGPLFFSGLIKSRTLTQIKRRLQETITYHHNEAASLKSSKSIATNQPQSSKTLSKSNSMLVDDNLLPSLTIVDLTGESASDSESGDESRSDSKEETQNESFGPKTDTFNLISYHCAAEKMVGEYLCWLEEGEKVRAMPHHADIARFIPEHALEAAWKRAVSLPPPSQELDDFPLPTPRPPPDTTPAKTPLRKAVDNILKIKDRSRRRYRRTEIQSPVEDIDFRDARTLLSVIDKHLQDIERLAEEWCTEVSRISSLDGRLWELVSALRVNRPIPPVRKQCPQKCAPVTIVVPAREWCTSAEAERGLADNRRAARCAVRRLARARPHAARSAAALLAALRRVRSGEAAARVAERAWRSAGARAPGTCAPARALLAALVSALAEQWICDNGRLCSKLIAAWGKRGSSSLQHTLCGALVSPRRLANVDWPVVYTALLDSQLPSHAVFSYLSKFEMYRWSETADPTQRHDVLEALSRTIQRYGSTPASEDHMLVEILGVHTALVMTSHDLPAHVKSCARMSIENKLPHTHWTHVVRAVDAKAYDVPFDQLGHLLRELGVMWWEARTGLKGFSKSVHLAAYAPYVAKLLHALQRGFVAAGSKLSYAPERVAWYAWSALQESWGAWITPHSGSLPLLPSTGEDEQYTPMLRHFVDNVHQIMLDCPGTEINLLQQIFEWCVQTYVSVQTSPNVATLPSMKNGPSATQESRVQASALLAELSKLPWSEHQWFFGKCLQVALQISSSTDPELTSWCCATWRNTKAETLLRDVEDQLIPRLASLLYLFTGTLIPPPQQIVEEACKLPWHRLPELALDEALGRFYMVHHSVARPYHDLPQFRIILHASELAVPPGAVSVQLSESSRNKRLLCVSQWVRAASAPALHAHVTAHTACLLRTLTHLAAPLSSSENELEDLLSRALVIMCIEPAASTALPVWVEWVSGARGRLSLACVSGAGSLTVLEHAAALGDAAVRAALLCAQERASWGEASVRWAASPWRGAGQLARRGRLHACYASSLHAPQHQHALQTLQALLSADIHFIDNEVIVSVWICYAYRWALQGAEPETCAAARALLARWGEDERRSLLSRVTMQLTTDKPTPLHRLLCRYAQYMLTTDENSRRSFENSFLSALGSNSDLATWTIAPQPKKVVTLAIRLFPKHDNYFQYELEKIENLSNT